MRNIILLLTILFLIYANGCESQQYICGDTLCVTGEVIFKDDLPDGTAYETVSVDESRLIAALGGIPSTPQPIADSIPITNIVSDTLRNTNSYMGKVVKVEGTVDSDALEFPNKNVITLTTGNTDVVFYVTDGTSPALHDMTTYIKDETYHFSVFVIAIRPADTETPNLSIWTTLLETPKPSPVSLNRIVANSGSGGTKYLGKVLLIDATVQFDSAFYGAENDAISIVTNNDNVLFYIANWNTPPNRMGGYLEGKSYNFTIYIRQIENTGGRYFVQSNLVIE